MREGAREGKKWIRGRTMLCVWGLGCLEEGGEWVDGCGAPRGGGGVGGRGDIV